MTTLAIIILSLIELMFIGLAIWAIKEDMWEIALLLFFCGIAIGAAAYVDNITTKQPKVIRAKSIEQIDTLYRNGEVIGYELTITK